MVSVDSRMEEQKADAVLSDDVAGTRAVAEHLAALGHQHILHLCGPDSEAWSRIRRETFEAAVPCRSVQVPLGHLCGDRVREILAAHPDTTAVFAATDHIAHEVYNAAAALGLTVPDDLSVVGYSDLEFARYLTPSLTTVHTHSYDMGRRAAALMIERLKHPEPGTDARCETVPAELVVRQSTARPAS